MPQTHNIPIHLAPMQGYVDTAYLQARRQVYAQPDHIYTPFIRMERGEARYHDVKLLRRAWELDIPVVPQVIFSSMQEFELLTGTLRSMGAKRIDLNLGCPYPMQTRRGRGAAMIANIPVMEQVAEAIAADQQVAYSVKMRLGLNDASEWRALMPVLNAMPLVHVAVHPRVAAQMYEGELCLDAFRELAGECRHPLVFNGDVTTPGDINRIAEEYNAQGGVMIGRGLLGRPSLIDEWRSGEEWDRPRRMEAVMRIHQALFSIYESTLSGEAQMLQKLKPFWEYLEPEIGRKAAKAIHKAGSMAKYRAAVGSISI